MDKIKKSYKYLDQVKQKIKDNNGPKKEFWERELKKTQTTIERLTK